MEDKNTTEDKNKGLTDKHDGDLILNESGTSVHVGHLDEDQEVDQEQKPEVFPENDAEENMDKGMAQVPYDITDPA